jgi:hypothetical protein
MWRGFEHCRSSICIVQRACCCLQLRAVTFLEGYCNNTAIASIAMLVLKDRRQYVPDGNCYAHAPRNISQSGADSDGLGHYFSSVSDRGFAQTLRVKGNTQYVYPPSHFLGARETSK